MESDLLSVEIRAKKVRELARTLRPFLNRESESNYSSKSIGAALLTLVERHFDVFFESLEDRLTPGQHEYKQFLNILEDHLQLESAQEVQKEVQLALAFGDESVFNGHRSYTQKKLKAMIEYIADRGRGIYETNLNKLLFYSDLCFYYLHREGISGAVHLNRPFGPVADPVKVLLKDLELENRIEVSDDSKNVGKRISASRDTTKQKRNLTKDERELIDWVLETYGDLTPTEISDYSHTEMAYKFTEPNERIAYEYAKFFKVLPPRTLLSA